MRLHWLFFSVVTTLAAQAPGGWNQRPPLGFDGAADEPWYGAGLWAADHHGPTTTLTDSLGLGNGLTGGGFHLEGGFRWRDWDVAAEVLGNRNSQGQAYLTLYRSHLWYRGRSGWQGGFEQEPLVWGYGLNGGYLLGEAARPFPRLRVESPMAPLRILRVPLGTWGWQAFMGRMESHPVLAGSIQDASWRRRAWADNGNPAAPFLMGYRAQAEFGPLLEFYINYLNLWGGTLNGRGMTQGYNLGDYLTAVTGLKDPLAEAGTDYSTPGQTAPGGVNKANSASEFDWGIRFKAPALARALRADTVHLYLSRGSKSVLWPVKVFLKRPFYYAGKDLRRDFDNLVANPNLGMLWYQNSRYTAPSESVPNDTVGILAAWPRVRAGLEYFSGVNSADQGNRPFTHWQYLSGFYSYGDPLGNAMGGEAIVTTARLEVDFSSRLTGATVVIRGHRPFRDVLADWQLDHPGASPAKNRFTQLQQTLRWKAGRTTTLTGSMAWQRQGAVEYVSGRYGNGFAWFLDLSFRWPDRFVPGWS